MRIPRFLDVVLRFGLSDAQTVFMTPGSGTDPPHRGLLHHFERLLPERQTESRRRVAVTLLKLRDVVTHHFKALLNAIRGKADYGDNDNRRQHHRALQFPRLHQPENGKHQRYGCTHIPRATVGEIKHRNQSRHDTRTTPNTLPRPVTVVNPPTAEHDQKRQKNPLSNVILQHNRTLPRIHGWKSRNPQSHTEAQHRQHKKRRKKYRQKTFLPNRFLPKNCHEKQQEKQLSVLTDFRQTGLPRHMCPHRRQGKKRQKGQNRPGQRMPNQTSAIRLHPPRQQPPQQTHRQTGICQSRRKRQHCCQHYCT